MYTSPAAQMSLYFNSTIVQLIETRKNTTDFTCKNFNSTIVQLIETEDRGRFQKIIISILL